MIALDRLPRRGRSAVSLAAALLLNLGFVLLLVALDRDPRIEVRREASRVAVVRELPPPLPPPPADDEPPPPPDEAPLEMEMPPLADTTPAPMDLPPAPMSLSALPALGLPVPRVAASRPAGGSTPGPEPTEERPPAPPAPKGPMEADDVDRPPREYRSNPEPSFPRIAMRRQLSGSVRVRMLVGTDGRVKDWSVLRRDGHSSFESEVAKVIPRLRFQPGEHGGRKVEVWGTKTFDFLWEQRP